MKLAILSLLLGLMLAGCAPGATPVEPAAPADTLTPAPPVIAIATATPVSSQAPPENALPSPEAATPAAPTEPAAEATPTSNATTVVYGRTDDGAFFHGAADAPVTLIDYSDFL
jgi:hypothetical protein